MALRKIEIQLENDRCLKIPIDLERRRIHIQWDSTDSFPLPLICYHIDLKREKERRTVYFFQHVHPQSQWYRHGIRHGDRLLGVEDEDLASIIMDQSKPFSCEVIWHPELYLELNTRRSERDPHHHFDSPIVNSMAHFIRYLLTNRPIRPEEFSLSFEEPKESEAMDFSSTVFLQRQALLSSNRSKMDIHSDEIMRNLLESDHFFERNAVGLNKEETFWIWLSMKNFLRHQSNIQKLRFWGKIFGLKQDYYIIEADLDGFEGFDLKDPEFVKYQEEYRTEEEEEGENRIHRHHFERRKVPPELIGDGINQKLFFVSTGTTEPFVQLPLLTPEQISLSRYLQRFFVGDLEAPVEPFYPGVEKHLLRALIQRISAGTQIGPKNYFHLPSVDEEERSDDDLNDAEKDKMRFDVNPVFRGNKLEDLALPYGQFWVHCAPYIYEQGQTDPHRRSLIPDETLRQSPQALAPLDEDKPINDIDPAWSVRLSSTLVPEHSLICVRSNRWPGAYAVGDRERFKNVYIGWGMKNFEEHRMTDHRAHLPHIEYEYQLIEVDDPTVEEEHMLLPSSLLFSPGEELDSTSDLT